MSPNIILSRNCLGEGSPGRSSGGFLAGIIAVVLGGPLCLALAFVLVQVLQIEQRYGVEARYVAFILAALFFSPSCSAWFEAPCGSCFHFSPKTWRRAWGLSSSSLKMAWSSSLPKAHRASRTGSRFPFRRSMATGFSTCVRPSASTRTNSLDICSWICMNAMKIGTCPFSRLKSPGTSPYARTRFAASSARS